MNYILGTIAVCLLLSNVALPQRNKTIKPARADGRLKISLKPWGPTERDVENAKARTESSSAVQGVLKGTKYRLVDFQYIENALNATGKAQPPVRFRVVFYDYSNDRTYVAKGDFAQKEQITVRQENFVPGVSNDEIEGAIAIVKTRRGRDKTTDLEISAAMPPITNLDGERLINILVRDRVSGESKIVGVSFKNDNVVDYESGAPPTAKAAPESCGITPANQPTTGPGVAGQMQLTVSDGPTTLWTMLVTRPSVSSGSQSSGIELQNVSYKGKSVLKHAHTPVLNVKYAQNLCGPFVDWQYDEGYFAAPDSGATDPAPGFRILAPGQVATTSLESGIDQGNFRGVAIYTQGSETVLVSEMEAGWYRYIMEWRFDADGTIRPRYGFGATINSCVCAVHYHHIYWRFDFDVVQTNNKVFQVERGRKFQTPVSTEIATFRRIATNRSFLVQNSNGNEAYVLVPGLADGNWTDGDPTFGKGDFWILKTVPTELDTYIGASINITQYVNGESLSNTDVTIWYGAHFAHTETSDLLSPDRSPTVLGGSHVVGPDLRPIRW